jgi:hypothetical protein
MRKAIFILGVMLALLSCEVKQTWLVTTTTETRELNSTTGVLIRAKWDTYTEVMVDYTKKEIEEYCAPSYYSEQFGTKLYQYFTTRTYDRK